MRRTDLDRLERGIWVLAFATLICCLLSLT